MLGQTNIFNMASSSLEHCMHSVRSLNETFKKLSRREYGSGWWYAHNNSKSLAWNVLAWYCPSACTASTKRNSYYVLFRQAQTHVNYFQLNYWNQQQNNWVYGWMLSIPKLIYFNINSHFRCIANTTSYNFRLQVKMFIECLNYWLLLIAFRGFRECTCECTNVCFPTTMELEHSFWNVSVVCDRCCCSSGSETM